MNFLAKIFTWWNGATIGTLLHNWRHGVEVGTDAQGNRYFRSRKTSPDGRERRWVIYDGSNDASRVPPEWHGWLHGQFDDVPESRLPPPRIWEADYTPNATGTEAAYLPQGALQRGGRRAAATGDYEAWSPDS
ncbi:NADH:ubiquinone oxidoreductase subunit NDUFA12 [Pelagerythrobacter aerophilus]|uniref:NADH:ubiquinone oxidoreductase subunit NDUFA12 n=1 Tax=Pelagerythrobacter aerophilus TaxID=2306995 RepID=A0A418NG23_9SPHN|nr:NADH:ubiquinone oxidoreductase subunit NDUFA12 [Pelagerythrobacter aerophilus]RIV76923.1 NADH:ubiquinone oxidoreductase subunit NDUFA12 [Pelagerythrobacter aerophilus]